MGDRAAAAENLSTRGWEIHMQVKGPANTEHASKTPPHSVSQSDWHNWAIKPLVLVTKFGRSGDSLHSSI